MDRRPLGSIDPNSIRETELHTECRRRRDRESLYSPRHDRERDAARQRAAATRRKETDEARAERLRANRQRIATRRQQETTQAREARCVCIRPGLCLSVCFSVLRALVACNQSLVAIEFSQHRHRSFRLVIASLRLDQRHKDEYSENILKRRLVLPPPTHKQAAGEPTKRSYKAPAGDITSDRGCLLYTSPSPRDLSTSRMPSSA